MLKPSKHHHKKFAALLQAWWDRRCFTCGEVAIELGLPLSTTEEFMYEHVRSGTIEQMTKSELSKTTMEPLTLAFRPTKRG